MVLWLSKKSTKIRSQKQPLKNERCGNLQIFMNLSTNTSNNGPHLGVYDGTLQFGGVNGFLYESCKSKDTLSQLPPPTTPKKPKTLQKTTFDPPSFWSGHWLVTAIGEIGIDSLKWSPASFLICQTCPHWQITFEDVSKFVDRKRSSRNDWS